MHQITDREEKNLNRSMRANQDIQIGTYLREVGNTLSASGTMCSQSSSNINVSGGSLSNIIITSASITNSKFSGSIVTPYPPVVGQILSFGSQGNEWINNLVPNGLVLQGGWNALTNTPDLVTGSSLIPTGHMWRVSVAGSTVLGPETTWEVNDLAVKTEDSWVEIEAATTMSTWGNITGSLVDQTDLWADLNSRVSASTLALHTNATGISVHGLGTISTQTASAVNLKGIFDGSITGSATSSASSLLADNANTAASSVNYTTGGGIDTAINLRISASTLALHTNATGSSVHGLGTISTQNANTISASGSFTGTITSASAKFGTGNDYTTFEVDGTLVMSGSATVYDDLVMPFFVAKTGTSNVPIWSALVGNINAYVFQANDYLEATAELLHDYKEDSNLELHVHWATNGTNVDDRFVKWEIEYSVANMGTGAFSSASVVSNETTIPANTPTKTHMYTSVNTVAGTGFKIGAQFICRVRRIAALNGSAPSANPFGLAAGIHYQMDTLGSRLPTSK